MEYKIRNENGENDHRLKERSRNAQLRAMAGEADRLHRNGLTNREIAFRMGVSEEVVRALRGGRR